MWVSALARSPVPFLLRAPARGPVIPAAAAAQRLGNVASQTSATGDWEVAVTARGGKSLKVIRAARARSFVVRALRYAATRRAACLLVLALAANAF
jgi:hypothetical protein